MFNRHNHEHNHDHGGDGRHNFGERMMHFRGMGRHGHGGPGRGRGGPGGGRMFQHGDLRLLILALIAEAPRHGYEIIREIESRLGGAYAPSPGVVYPTLTMLEELGFATSETTEGSKRQYTITDAGTANLAENQATVDAIFAKIEDAGSGPDFGPRILRAMANLRFALKLRLGRGGVDDSAAAKIAAALDAAAAEIERS
ncbi:PadR family transcriptional regulator [Polymorphobacter sp. PAMC 29334]|nr:PadR family transcriptional regulator [Polymorphobacter sp. PAMC 29334]